MFKINYTNKCSLQTFFINSNKSNRRDVTNIQNVQKFEICGLHLEKKQTLETTQNRNLNWGADSLVSINYK